jgi:proteic killer suppression protein
VIAGPVSPSALVVVCNCDFCLLKITTILKLENLNYSFSSIDFFNVKCYNKYIILNISFKTKKLEKVCSSEAKLNREYGILSRTIMSRLSFLKSAPNLEDVPHHPPHRRHKLKGEYQGMFAVDIKHPKRLIFQPVNIHPDDEISLKEVVSIEIIAITDYH